MSKTSKQLSKEKVTSVEKSVKEKDPRKVELGKRLAEISKEAKERKAKQREEQHKEISKLDSDDKKMVNKINSIANFSDYLDFRYLVGGVTIVTAIGGFYYAYKNDVPIVKREQSEKSELNEAKEKSEQSEKLKQSENNFEITKCNRPSNLTPKVQTSRIDINSKIDNL